MKGYIIGLGIAIGWLLLGSCTMRAGNTKKVSEVRKVAPFTSIDVTSVAAIYFTQGDVCSLKMEGEEEYVKKTTTQVTDGCLKIGFKREEKKNFQNTEGLVIYLTAPDLQRLDFTGVGSFCCEEPLKVDCLQVHVEGVGKVRVDDLTCQTLEVHLEGVGSAELNVQCNALSAHLEGIGSVSLSGRAGRADIRKDGLGSVNTNRLKIGE